MSGSWKLLLLTGGSYVDLVAGAEVELHNTSAGVHRPAQSADGADV